ncbi:MAG: carbohydrate ABC transporter permease [Paenibacillus macerans]|uniref:Binding--dependent transport system inner membrane component family protein n=2 Tax=Paenibacillus macerans TaxID=44252 RepID=A0A091A5T0_PAEMA|nr:carbohydrate ABC transporter permease [Paenibacillus macerans]KFN11596.1 binding--dependent transport system inner membrane component family protein [Paenibacillus macerans]MCM3703589.1 carbohydrate ABC transporter permease [Paenibacillus macerans]MCY7558955.1 carbohydrate ABC transporter permease [Paenibacillus macerans]MDU7475003.1 carbohydrate ABC transporter permease [Paenibacillus macerans]MEC0136674.1 carbohydrate ABC transporter permease [Paenibacillus macerans]
MMNGSSEKRLSAVSYILLSAGLVVIFLPLYLTVITAFKTSKESARNFFAFPSELYLGNFQEVLFNNNFFQFFSNSVLITLVSILLILLVVPLTAYAISRNMNKWYFKTLYILFIMGIIIPFQVIMLPVTRLMTELDLLNRFGLILLYVTYALTQGVFLYVGYIRTTIPKELEEAAEVDGCSKFRTYRSVIFPLLAPLTATVIIVNSFWIWNDFLLPLLILNKSETFWTLPLFQYNFKSQYSFNYNLAFASFVMTVIPIMLVYVFFQKQIIAGLTGGAVKS